MEKLPSFLLRVIVVCAAILTSVAAVEVPDLFAGVPWGASRDVVEKKMAERHYTKDPESKPHFYLYNGEFAGYKTDLGFFIINGKVYQRTVLLFYRNPNKFMIDNCFNDLEKQLISKYGQPIMRYRAEGKEPWQPWSDEWQVSSRGTTITISLYKSYEFPEMSVEGRVAIKYTNVTLKQQEERRAKERDL